MSVCSVWIEPIFSLKQESTPFVLPTVSKTCRHTFCLECVTQAIKSNPQCPVDRLSLKSEDIEPATPIIRYVRVFFSCSRLNEHENRWWMNYQSTAATDTRDVHTLVKGNLSLLTSVMIVILLPIHANRIPVESDPTWLLHLRPQTTLLRSVIN